MRRFVVRLWHQHQIKAILVFYDIFRKTDGFLTLRILSYTLHRNLAPFSLTLYITIWFHFYDIGLSG